MICRYIYVDEGVVGSGMGFSWLGATGHKTQKGPAKCVYCLCVLCVIYSFPPCGWNLCQVGRQFLSVVDNSKVWGIWFGLAECVSLQYLAQGEGQGGGLRSRPLAQAGVADPHFRYLNLNPGFALSGSRICWIPHAESGLRLGWIRPGFPESWLCKIRIQDLMNPDPRFVESGFKLCWIQNCLCWIRIEAWLNLDPGFPES